jgi:hypothetical protein
MIEKIENIKLYEKTNLDKKLNTIESYFIYILLKEIDIFKNEKKSFPFKIMIDNFYLLLGEYISENKGIGISSYIKELINKDNFYDNIYKNSSENKNVGRIRGII